MKKKYKFFIIYTGRVVIKLSINRSAEYSEFVIISGEYVVNRIVHVKSRKKINNVFCLLKQGLLADYDSLNYLLHALYHVNYNNIPEITEKEALKKFKSLGLKKKAYYIYGLNK